MLNDATDAQSTGIYKTVIDTILQLLPADTIYLAGTRHEACRSNSIFNAGAKQESERLSFLYLVIIANLEDKAAHEWQDRLEAHCKKIISCTTIVLDTTAFLQWLKEAHPFSCRVVQQANCLHRSAGYSVHEEALPIGVPSSSESLLAGGLNMYKEFMAAAELFSLRKQNRLACFMLHQAMELGLHSILKAGAGFHYRTHNIERLMTYASLVHEELFYWTHGTEKHRKLLHKLQQAYSGARYDECYGVNACELNEITQLVKRLEGFFEGGKGCW